MLVNLVLCNTSLGVWILCEDGETTLSFFNTNQKITMFKSPDTKVHKDLKLYRLFFFFFFQQGDYFTF